MLPEPYLLDAFLTGYLQFRGKLHQFHKKAKTNLYLTIFHEMNFLFSLDNLILLKWQMHFSVASDQRYTYRVLQTVQMKLILLCVWAEPAVLGNTKTALKFKYEILIG